MSEEMEFESNEDIEPLEIPEDKRRVKTEIHDLPIETLNSWVTRGKIDPQPDFQRFYVWPAQKASRLIESLLLEIPIPVVYLAEDDKGNLSVVDGQQRITSICSFISGQFPNGNPFILTGLQVLKELNENGFKELDQVQQDKILSSIIRVIKITKDSDPDVKFEVFERLNVGAVKLNDQELRNSVYRGKYNNLLIKLSENKTLLKIMGRVTPHERMVDRQMILRFFVMWRNTHLKYKGSMKQAMNREMANHRNPTEKELNEMESIFVNSIEMAYTVFGKNAFRRFNIGSETDKNGSWETRKLNIALWDTLLYTFSYYDKNQVVPIADAIREEFLDLMTTDTTFVEYISSSTDKVDRVKYRADTWRARMDSLVSSKEPRNFTSALKEKLFKASPTCTLCKQKIQDIDDSEVDHIVHYWRGGKTIPENAGLAHRYCNRAKGGR